MNAIEPGTFEHMKNTILNMNKVILDGGLYLANGNSWKLFRRETRKQHFETESLIE